VWPKTVIWLRPCVRRNLTNFSFSWVLEMFGCWSLEIFQRKTGIFELANFLRKSLEKSLEIESSEKSLDIKQNCTSISKILKKLRKVWVYESKKTLLLGQKVLKKFGKVRKQGFPNIRKFRKLFYSELSENYEKVTLNSNFGNREKLVPTQKPTQKFG